MRSPFPGMDPYLEDRWRDVHSRLVLYASDQLQQQVTPRYRARVEERIILGYEFDDRRPPSFSPDVKIVRHWTNRPTSARAVESSVAVAEPVVVRVPAPESLIETSVQIVDPKSGGTVVTVIEFLSPSNKRPGVDLDAFLAKQYELGKADVAIVEVDLLRAGVRATHFNYDRWPREARGHYAACVSRPRMPREAELYGFSLRGTLPAIRIPLRDGDADAVLNLQQLVDLAYVNGAYDDIDYARPPIPPLGPDDEAWADALLRAAGKRS